MGACSDAVVVVVAAACPQAAAASLLPAVAACLPGAAACLLEEGAWILAAAGSKFRSACLQRRRRGGGADCCLISMPGADLRRIEALTANVLPDRQTQSQSLPQKQQDSPRPQQRQRQDARRPHERCRPLPWRSERPAPPASSPVPAEPRPLTPAAAMRMIELRGLLVRPLVPTPLASGPARCRTLLLARERLSPPASTCGRGCMNTLVATTWRIACPNVQTFMCTCTHAYKNLAHAHTQAYAQKHIQTDKHTFRQRSHTYATRCLYAGIMHVCTYACAHVCMCARMHECLSAEGGCQQRKSETATQRCTHLGGAAAIDRGVSCNRTGVT